MGASPGEAKTRDGRCGSLSRGVEGVIWVLGSWVGTRAGGWRAELGLEQGGFGGGAGTRGDLGGGAGTRAEQVKPEL